MFAPRVVPHLPWLLRVPAISMLLAAGGPILRRLPGGAVLTRAATAGLSFSLAMLAEREALGEDVPGANDNASGCGVAAQLLVECARRPLRHTEVALLITGCEESGLLGAQAYLRRRPHQAANSVFLNFDTVGGAVPLTYVLREPSSLPRPASQRLVKLMEEIAADRPDLGLQPASSTGGLPTDATVMLGRGYEGITLLAQGRTIPNYHQPTDTVENLAPATVGCALAVGRELLARLDAAA
jgi:Peptidase family M28